MSKATERRFLDAPPCKVEALIECVMFSVFFPNTNTTVSDQLPY